MPTRPKRMTATLLTPALNNVCADQQAAGAGNFTINGSLASGGAVSLTTAHRLDIESAGNISGVTFTITGTDENGDALVEIITGPNATTVTTTGYFKTITQVAVDGAVGTNTSIGTTDEFRLNILPLNPQGNEVGCYIGVYVSGTINYTVQETVDDVLDSASPRDGVAAITPAWVDITAFADKTANVNASSTALARGLRLEGNSYTAGATISMAVSQG